MEQSVSQINRCLFCGFKKINSIKKEQFLCGAYKIGKEYATSILCDKECFRNAYLRCYSLLCRVIEETDHNIINQGLLNEIKKEVE